MHVSTRPSLRLDIPVVGVLVPGGSALLCFEFAF